MKDDDVRDGPISSKIEHLFKLKEFLPSNNLYLTQVKSHKLPKHFAAFLPKMCQIFKSITWNNKSQPLWASFIGIDAIFLWSLTLLKWFKMKYMNFYRARSKWRKPCQISLQLNFISHVIVKFHFYESQSNCLDTNIEKKNDN